MASKAKQDLTGETALSAVEEALSADFTDSSSSSTVEEEAIQPHDFEALIDAQIEDAANEIINTTQLESQNAEVLTPNEAEVTETPKQENKTAQNNSAPAEKLLPELPPVAANDEVNSELASVLYAMQQKPRSRVFFITLILSLIWLGLCAYYAFYNLLPELNNKLELSSVFSNTNVMIFAAVTILPLLPLWAFAVLVRRSQEMRHAANSMTEAAIHLLQPESTTSNSVATVGRAIRREVNALGDGVERAIARAGELEFMVQKEVMNLERSYGDSEIRLRKLVEEIGTERESIIGHAEQLKTTIADTHSGLSSELEITSNKLGETLRNVTDSMSETLVSRSDTITSHLTNTSETLINLLETTGNDLNSKIDLTKTELEENVRLTKDEMANTITSNGKAVARLLETRTASLQEFTTKVDEKLAQGKDIFENSFSDKITELSDIMSTTGQSVSNLLKSTTTEVAEQSRGTIQQIEDGRSQFRMEMSEQATEFSKMVDSYGATIKGIVSTSASDVAEHGNNMIQEFEGRRTVLNQNIQQQTEEIATILAQTGDKINEQVVESANVFEDKGSSIAQQISDNLSIRAGEFASQIADAGAEIQSSIEDRVATVESGLAQNGNNLINALDTKVAAIDNLLKDRTDAIDTTIGDRLSGLDQSLTSQVEGAVLKLQGQTENLHKTTQGVEEIISERTQQIEEAIRNSTIGFSSAAEASLTNANERTAEINAVLESTSGKLTQSINAASSLLTNKLEDTSNSVSSQITEASKLFSNTISSNKEEIGKALETTSNQTTESINAASNQLIVQLESASVNVNGKIVEATEQFADIVYSNKTEIGNVLDSKKEEIVSALNDKQSAFTDLVTETSDNLTRTVEEKVNNLSAKLSQGTHHISTVLEEKSLAAAERMDNSVKGLDKRLAESTYTIEKQFAAGNQILDERLTKGKDELLEAISISLSNVGETIDGKAEKISDLLSERAELINTNLGSSLVETQRNLETKTTELNDLLASRTAELSSLIDNRAKPIVDSILSAGSETGEALAVLSRTLSEEANILFANIGNSSTLLEDLIKNASGNLDMMQGVLSTQISSFSNAVDTTKSNVNRTELIAADLNEKMQNASNEMLIGIGGIAQRFEAQGTILQDATRLIDAAQNNLESTLENKQSTLQQIAAGLVTRSDEINTNITSFGSVVNSMVEEVSNKSKHISNSLTNEMSTAIDDATSRFGDAVDAMRSAAATMRQELEETREQMRRGVLELPDETQKNATAMRRVVTDQIAALRDLSAIVEKSGKVLDTAPPIVQPQAATQAPQAQQAVYEQQTSVPAPQEPVPQPSVASIDMTLRGTRSEPMPLHPVAQQQPPQEQTPSNQGAGWVSDLLRRASQEEHATAVNPQDNRSPNQVVDSLNSLSIDIANAIDHETSVDLWERYQRGETNVFTRRLYTLQGQQTFDEIRNKYIQQPDFKSAVDRYINDFEQLLAKETENGRNQALTQSYLTSETGKVYTMLAHASGKLGS